MRARERAARRRAATWWTVFTAGIATCAIAMGIAAAAAHATYVPLGERFMPGPVAVDQRTGVVYVGDSDGSVCRVLSVNATGIPEVLVGGSGSCSHSGDGGPAADAETWAPDDLAVDGAGNVYVSSGYTVRRVSKATGDITAWAGRHEYTCLAVGWRGPVPRVGSVAAEVAFHAAGLAIHPRTGHLFILDNCNEGIWEVDESGVVVARYAGIGTERLASAALAFGPEGDLYFAEGSANQQIVKMDASGRFTTIAGNGGTRNTGDGGPATLAELGSVSGVVVDSRGYLFFAAGSLYLRGITPEGTIFAVAGKPWPAGVTPPLPGTLARDAAFYGLRGVAVDADDNLYVSDWDNKLLFTLSPPAEPGSTVSWILHERIEALPGERLGGGNPSTNDCDQGCYGDPVNTASGEYWERQIDLELPGRGPALSFARSYSAQSDDSGPLGHGWTASYLMSLDAGGPGGMVTIQQENGSTIAFEPNGSGGWLGPAAYLATLRHNEDGTWTLTRRARDRFDFDAEGRLVRARDLNGETTTLSYDEAGRLATVTDAGGQTIRLQYDGSGRIERLDDSAGRTVRYGYTSGDLTSVVDVRGQTWIYAYDEQDRLTRRIDPNGHLDVENAYDSADRVTRQTDANEGVTRFDYRPGMTQITSPAGHMRRDWYGSGQLVKRQEGVGTASAASWSYEYDAATHGTTKVTDPLGHVWRATYDAAGRLTSTTDPLSHTTRATYDSLGDMLTFVDASNVTTTFTYDANGNLLTRSTPLSAEVRQVTRYVHGDEAHSGDITAIVDPREKTTTLTYDGNGNVAAITDPLANRTTMAYDAAGTLRTVVSPLGNAEGGRPEQHTTTYVRDAAGLLTQATDPLGSVTRWSYDAAGNLASVTDPKLHTTTYGYDDADLLTTIRRANETTLRRAYDADGNLTTATDGASNAASYGYDARDRLTSTTDPLRRTTTYAYDAAGNLTRLVDPAERATTYGYDNANRLTSIAYSDGVTPNVTLGYDNAGHRTSMRDGTGTSSYTWDALGRLTQHTDGLGATVRYGYDLAGNLTRLTYPGTEAVTRAYDDAGRLASLTDWLGGTTRFAYDADSNLLATTFPEASGNVDASTYDNAGRLAGSTFKQGTTTLASLTYAERDATGLPRRILSSGLPWSARLNLTYDPLDRISLVNAQSYAFNGADDLTELASARPLAYDAGGQLREGPVPPGTAEAPATFSYDPDGNRTGATVSGSRVRTYAWDQADRLASLEGTTIRRRTYGYDGDGLRMSRTWLTNVTRFAWDRSGALPLLLTDGTNRYVYGPGGLPLEQVSSSGVVTYLHHDEIGSTRLLTEARGAASGTFSYTPYGSLAGSTGTATTPFGFAGEYADSESGLIYLRARSYDPATGQFMSRDPLASVTGQPYGYANGNPLAYVDPSGLLEVPSMRQVADRYVGAVDTMTGGLTGRAREMLHLNGGLDVCSWDYRAGADVMHVAMMVELLAGTAGEAALPMEIRIFENLRRGGRGLFNMRYPGVREIDNRFIGLDFHPIPTRGGRRWRPHLDIPPWDRRHWPFVDPK